MITIQRTLAISQNWKVIPRHPLANDVIHLLDYALGFQSIDWDAMNRRDYHDPLSKSVCMAECLSPTAVLVEWFFAIYVPDDLVGSQVSEIAAKSKVKVGLELNKYMFL